MIHGSLGWSLGALAACVVLLNGCAGNGAKGQDSPPPLQGAEWHLTHAGTAEAIKTLPKGMTITLQIAKDGAASGTSGCNTYRSSATVNGQSIRFSPIAMTKKMCPDPPEVMAWEQRFVTALAAATTFATEGTQLTLHGPESHELRFSPGLE